MTVQGMQEIVTALQSGGGAQLRLLKLASTGPDFVEVNEMARLWKQKLRADGHCPNLLPGEEEAAGGNGGGVGGVAPVPAAAAGPV